MSQKGSDLFARWAPGIALAIIYAYFTVVFSREYFVSHKSWLYLLLSAVCCLVSAGMISFTIYKTVLEDKIKEARRAVDEACPRCGGLGEVGIDGYPGSRSSCPVCNGSGRTIERDLLWVAGGQARRIAPGKRPTPDPDKEEPFGVKGSL